MRMYDYLVPSVNFMGANSISVVGERCKILGGKKALIVTDKFLRGLKGGAVELTEKYLKEDDSFLDVGCGSGILSIAALLLGAKSATGVDIDALAVKTANENEKINHVAEKFTGIYGNLTEKISGKFSVIAANIVADIVILLSEDVPAYMKPDTTYIISGIIDTREDDVLRAITNRFTILERREEKGWVAMALRLKA